MLVELKLLGGDLVAIDGAFFHGDASKASIVTRKRLAEQVAALEQDIAAYAAALEANDAAEADAAEPSGGDAAQKLAALMAKRAAAQADLARLPLIAYLAKRAVQFIILLRYWVIAAFTGGIRQWRMGIWGVPAGLGAFADPGRGHHA